MPAHVNRSNSGVPASLAAPADADSARQAREARLKSTRMWIWREVRINVSITVVSAALFATALRQPFLENLLYSFCIATSIQILVDVGRKGIAWWFVRNRMTLAPTGAGSREIIAAADKGWPGWAFMGPWVAFSAVTGWVIGECIGDRLLGVTRLSVFASGQPRPMLFTLVCVLSISLGVTYFFYVRGRLASSEVRAEAAMRSAAENQLKLLMSQLEPHMLFNTLANLRVLIGQDPPRAQAMLDHLNGFLRATLDASRVEAHALSAEFARVSDYLELMKVRMGPRLRSELDLPPELSGLRVPPLLIQPLVENSIKHGLEPKIAGGVIAVSARREGDSLVLSVRDTGVGLGEADETGTHFGLCQIRDRLAALYGDAGSLELRQADDDRGGVLAVVRLPADGVQR